MGRQQQSGHEDVTSVRHPFLTAAWRDLVLLNYRIDPAALLPLVPLGTELDLWDQQALVSIVGFRFLETRVLGLAVPFHVNFDEINLRFYVRRQVGEATRHGVVFLREVVARAAIASVARITYNEPYVTLPMRHFVDLAATESGGTGVARYEWKQDRWYTLEATVAGPPAPFKERSEAEFLTHRMWGYTTQRDGGTIEYRVSHPRWRIWNPVGYRLDCDTSEMYGRQLGAALKASPFSALVAEGSRVEVFPGVRVT